MHAQGLHGVPCLGSRDPQAAAVNRIYPTGACVEKNRLAQPFLAMRGCIGHDVKAVLHRENACRKHSAVCQLQRSRDRKVLAKRCCSRYRTCRFTAGRNRRACDRSRSAARARATRARTDRAPRGARERECHGAQTNARFKVLRQVGHANSRRNRFEHGIYVPEL